MTERRRKAIIRRRIFVALVAALMAVIVALIVVIVATIKNGADVGETSSDVSSVISKVDVPVEDVPYESAPSSQKDASSKPETFETPTGEKLDANYGRLLLVNGKNPLPDDYENNVKLTTIDKKYINGFRNQINTDVWPYAKAMVEAAWADGVELYILSPYRSVATQRVLFNNEVAEVGGDEEKAATVVARPGTSEHNTGLCIDFNMVEDEFEDTPMFKWLCKNAENYGFILRYPKGKQPITGVIYESWHWRFVGINNAKLINDLGVTLEEYIEMKELDPKMDMYGDDSAQDTAEQILD